MIYLITKAKFSSTPSKATTLTRCNEPRRGTCNLIITGESITFKNEKTWKLKSDMNCLSRSIIYAIIYARNVKSSILVRQTKNLRNRVTIHKGQLKHEKDRHLYVSEHLNLCNAGNFKICPLYNCYTNTRLSKESREKET